MTTVQQLYEAMQALAPLELAESWDNPGLLVDCGGEVTWVLVTLDITPEVVAEAAAKHCEAIVAHHPVIFDPLKKLGPQDVPFQLVRAGISAICMHTNLDAAAGGVNEVLAGIFGMQDPEPFAEGCGRVGSIEPSRCRSWPARHSRSWPPAAMHRTQARRCKSSLPTPANRCGGWPSSAVQAAACLKRLLPWARTVC